MKKIYICMGMVVILGLGGGKLYPFVKYNMAENLLEKGKYELAKSHFEELGNFSDSKTYIKECDYQIASSYVKKAKYDEALQILDTLDSYKDVQEIIKECIYNQALLLGEDGQYNNAIETFSRIIDYKDASTQIKEIEYTKAKNLYKQGHFKSAKVLFEKLEDYKESALFLEKCTHLETYLGTWKSQNTSRKLIIDKWDIAVVGYVGEKVVSRFEIDTTLLNDWSLGSIMPTSYVMSSNGNTITEYNLNPKTAKRDTIEDIFIKVNDTTTVPESPKQKVSPYIGMTKKELEDSLWGKPRDINRTTTAYNVKEQWCYSGNRYVYVEDGVITAIQD